MILISDGDDNLSDRTRAEAIEMAQRTNVVIYTISTSTQWIQLSQTDPSKAASRKMHLTEGDEILKNLAEETGGRAFFPYHVDDLNQSFQDIGDELRNQYTITYSPSNFVANGKYHRIKIEIPNHNGYQVRARRGYFAKSRTSAAKPHRAPSLPLLPANRRLPSPSVEMEPLLPCRGAALRCALFFSKTSQCLEERIFHRQIGEGYFEVS